MMNGAKFFSAFSEDMRYNGYDKLTGSADRSFTGLFPGASVDGRYTHFAMVPTTFSRQVKGRKAEGGLAIKACRRNEWPSFASLGKRSNQLSLRTKFNNLK